MTEKPRFELPMGPIEIQQCIPHRPPFLLIDRITEYQLGERIVALKAVSISEPALSGHFPNYPVLPGVYIAEGMAQASAVLGNLTWPECTECLLTEINSARFKKQVVPGDLVEYVVTVGKSRKPFFWFEGEAIVRGEQVAALKFSARLT